MYLAIHLFSYRLAHLLILQGDPIDKNSPAYHVGQYCAYAFIFVFILAVIYAVYKKSRKK